MSKNNPDLRLSIPGALVLALAGMPPVVAGPGQGDPVPSPPGGTVEVEIQQPGGIHLSVREAAIGTALDALSGRLGVPIRHAGAPERPVSLSCRGESIRPVLRCLLGAEADLLFQYADTGAPAKDAEGVSSVTVLASTFRDEPAGVPPTASRDAGAGGPNRQADEQPTLEGALAMTRSPDAETRTSGLELLGGIEGIDRDVLRTAYQAGLHDQDGDTRATALLGLAGLDGENSFGLLTEALGDEDPSVRLAAVDGMAVNDESRPYLQKALTDPDESVRELAGLRLGILQ